jgi:hypothetical protein
MRRFMPQVLFDRLAITYLMCLGVPTDEQQMIEKWEDTLRHYVDGSYKGENYGSLRSQLIEASAAIKKLIDLQSDARHEHHRRPATPGGDEGITTRRHASVRCCTTAYDGRHPNQERSQNEKTQKLKKITAPGHRARGRHASMLPPKRFYTTKTHFGHRPTLQRPVPELTSGGRIARGTLRTSWDLSVRKTKETSMKILFAAATLAVLTVPALAGPGPVQKLAADGLYTQAQIRVEVEGDRDRDRDGMRRGERREWRERHEERCRVTIIRRDDGSVRRIRRCRD